MYVCVCVRLSVRVRVRACGCLSTHGGGVEGHLFGFLPDRLLCIMIVVIVDATCRVYEL